MLSLEAAWMQALDRADCLGLSASSIVFLIENFEHSSTMIKLLESLPRNKAIGDWLFETLKHQASNSSYALQEWFKALEVLLQYLIREGRSSSFETALGYLTCAAEYLSQGSQGFGLAQGVGDFLADYGYDG